MARTVATAGRTVAFSGVTVAIALASLMLFPETFLRSMGYGGVLTVLVDMVAALTVMPALLSAARSEGELAADPAVRSAGHRSPSRRCLVPLGTCGSCVGPLSYAGGDSRRPPPARFARS